MIKEEQEVKTYRVIARCECGGRMIPTGIAYSTFPIQYPHVCDKCEKMEALYDTYPKIVYEYAEAEVRT